MLEIIKRYRQCNRGNFSIFFAVGMMTLLMLIGVAIDISSSQAHYKKSQNIADVASIAAAKYMSESLVQSKSHKDFKKHKNGAKKSADSLIQSYLDDAAFTSAKSKYDITDTYAKVTLNLKVKTQFMGMFGKKYLPVSVSSTAVLANEGTKDLDLVLMTDATGSMTNQLMGIQNNMKQFTTDLQNELNASNLKLGTVRVKFIFFRDYMVDNDSRWTGRSMNLLPGMEMYGPMYESKFYELPGDKNAMDNYVDFFTAQGGGSFRESGFEAIWHALTAKGWGNGETTVRSLVLWTDATPRPLGDTVEDFALSPVPSPASEPYYYFNSAYWDKHIGSHFTALDKEAREDYVVDNFYPTDVPSDLNHIKDKLEAFHLENSNGKDDVVTFNLNIVSDCWGNNPCGEWDHLNTWDGVKVTEDNSTVSGGETYDSIVRQVAETIRSQVAARDIAVVN